MPPSLAFPWLRVALFGLWCAVAGALAGQFLPLDAIPRGAGLLVLALLIALGLARAAWAMRAAVDGWASRVARGATSGAADRHG
ncbi:MAG TPA: hypothetical protein VKA84_28950 [Gemmatimonadaceae bacterium]|nr:hypothetical protein [Gemmatimonadaceae bacterium]